MSYLISFEGVEGAGKSTIIAYVKDYLEGLGRGVAVTREPGGIEIAEKIRSVILDQAHTAMDGKTEALLYAAARRQHLVEKIVPLLNEGKLVLCDRFIDSSLAYQGYARDLGIDEVLSINEFAIGNFMPSLTLYLDLDPTIGLERIRKNKQREVNRLDLEELSFHRKVYEGYQKVMARFPERVVRVDADQEINHVFSDVKHIIENKLKYG